MTFIVTLIALLIERFFDWSHLRRWQWFVSFQRSVIQRLPGKSPYLILTASILPLLAAVLLIQVLLKGSLYGLTEFVFQLLLFLYCLGPQNLWADTFACVNAIVHGDAQLAAEKLQATFGVSGGSSAETLPGQLLNNVFIAANRRVFAIVFWFMVLGPVGAVLYRALTLSSASFPQQEAAPELIQSARTVEAVFDWVPVRLLTCVFALGGHFVNVVSCWRQPVMMNLFGSDKLLTDCGAAALGYDDVEKVSEKGAAVKSAISLLDRAFVISLVMVAMVVLLS